MQKPLKTQVSANEACNVTAHNYVSKAIEFANRKGTGFVIRTADGAKGTILTGERATEPQWHAWDQYLDGLQGQTQASKKLRADLGMTTVPSEWPEEFDSTAPLSDRDWRLPPRLVQSSADKDAMHARIIAGFAALSRGIDPGPDPRAVLRRKDETLQEAERVIADGFSHLQGPLKVIPGGLRAPGVCRERETRLRAA